jgi:hypothetical protein
MPGTNQRVGQKHVRLNADHIIVSKKLHKGSNSSPEIKYAAVISRTVYDEISSRKL